MKFVLNRLYFFSLQLLSVLGVLTYAYTSQNKLVPIIIEFPANRRPACYAKHLNPTIALNYYGVTSITHEESHLNNDIPTKIKKSPSLGLFKIANDSRLPTIGIVWMYSQFEYGGNMMTIIMILFLEEFLLSE